MYIPRSLEREIRKHLSSQEVIALIGARQTGKTTMLKEIQKSLENSIYITFEDRDELLLFEESPKLFLAKYKAYRFIFLDEFQYSKQGGKHLKYIYDTEPNVKIIISGSSALDLTVHALSFLVGRVFSFTLHPLSFSEFLSYKNKNLFSAYETLRNDFFSTKNTPKIPVAIQNEITPYLEEFLIYGGYPKVVLASNNQEKEMILKNIYNTYFLRDIREVLGVVDDYKLVKLFRLLSLSLGNLIEYNELSQGSGYDAVTLKKYLNILQKTFILHLISPYFTNKRTEIVKNPKPYFEDSGLRNSVLSDFRSLTLRSDKGALFENFLCMEFVKKDMIPKFWRTKGQQEVDFVLEKNTEIIGIESKLSILKPEITTGMKTFLEKHAPKEMFCYNEKVFETLIFQDVSIHFQPHWLV